MAVNFDLHRHSEVTGGVAIVGSDPRLEPVRERLGFPQNAAGMRWRGGG
jgi:cystathionine gamma-lyase